MKHLSRKRQDLEQNNQSIQQIPANDAMRLGGGVAKHKTLEAYIKRAAAQRNA